MNAENAALARLARRAIVLCGAAMLAACSTVPDAVLRDPLSSTLPSGSRAPLPTQPACTDALKTSFAPDAQTRVLLVVPFRKGEPLVLTDAPSPAGASVAIAANDLCMVKLLVGPGNSGPAGAPSTSPGIGIEVWLPTPARWNERIHVKGGGGWAGGAHADVNALATSGSAGSPSATAGIEGAVSASTDVGNASVRAGVNPGGSFAMNPDGSVNTVLWRDFAQRAVHEMAVKTKALTRAYYGRDARYAYWNGFSTGGRQGMKSAQADPADFDGILAGAPAFNWTRFITAELYPQIVVQRDLGGVALTPAQHALVSNAAIAACDLVAGDHLGYVADPSQCRYDPTEDASVLCVADRGANATPACVTLAQARAFNKFWYGQTPDGSVPAPSADNGFGTQPSGKQRWYGLARGTSLSLLAGPTPFTIASDLVALELQDPTIATTSFVNATGNGADRWKLLSYVQLSHAFDRGLRMQRDFGDINTDHPDLSVARDRGQKILMYHGLADVLIPPQGSIHYFNRVAEQMGGVSAVQRFYRLYLVPGMAHGFSNGTANPAANPPLPTNAQLYAALTDWVERGIAPGRIDIASALTPGNATPKSRPICVYPLKGEFVGGPTSLTGSYECR